MAVHIVYLFIITILMVMVGALIDKIERDEERNRKYFAELRREYDRRINELKRKEKYHGQ